MATEQGECYNVADQKLREEQAAQGGESSSSYDPSSSDGPWGKIFVLIMVAVVIGLVIYKIASN